MMGDAAEYYSENYLPQLEEERELEDRAKEIKKEYVDGKLVWTNKIGSAFPVKEMSDVYVANCLKYLEAYPYEKHADTYAWIWVFKKEIQRRQFGKR